MTVVTGLLDLSSYLNPWATFRPPRPPAQLRGTIQAGRRLTAVAAMLVGALVGAAIS
jgi:hypothetical protein